MTDDALLNLIHSAALDSDWHYYINGKKKISKNKIESLRRFAKLVTDRERRKIIDIIQTRTKND